MEKIISDSTPFQAAKNQVMIGYSESGYTLAYSVDGTNWTQYSEATPANEVLVVNGIMENAYLMLSGNTGEVKVLI